MKKKKSILFCICYIITLTFVTSKVLFWEHFSWNWDKCNRLWEIWVIVEAIHFHFWIRLSSSISRIISNSLGFEFETWGRSDWFNHIDLKDYISGCSIVCDVFMLRFQQHYELQRSVHSKGDHIWRGSSHVSVVLLCRYNMDVIFGILARTPDIVSVSYPKIGGDMDEVFELLTGEWNWEFPSFCVRNMRWVWLDALCGWSKSFPSPAMNMFQVPSLWRYPTNDLLTTLVRCTCTSAVGRNGGAPKHNPFVISLVKCKSSAFKVRADVVIILLLLKTYLCLENNSKHVSEHWVYSVQFSDS